MRMTFKWAAAAALVAVAPLALSAAPDAKKADPPAKEAKPAKEPAKAQEAPLPEKPDEAAVAKALKTKKPMYTKLAEAKEVAWKCQQPLFVALVVGGDEKSRLLESKVLKHRAFAKDFVPANCVLLVWRLKPGKPEEPQVQGRGRRRGPPPKPTTIDARPLKQPELDFLTKFAVSATAAANAKRRGDAAPKFTAMSCYPTVLCLDPACRKLYFRDPKYDTSLGNANASFGVWFSEVVAMFQGKTERETVVTPALQKIVDNPTEPKKWK